MLQQEPKPLPLTFVGEPANDYISHDLAVTMVMMILMMSVAEAAKGRRLLVTSQTCTC